MPYEFKRGRPKGAKDKKKRKPRRKKLGLALVGTGLATTYALKKRKDFKDAKALRASASMNRILNRRQVSTARQARQNIKRLYEKGRQPGGLNHKEQISIRDSVRLSKASRRTSKRRRVLQRSLHQKIRKLESPLPFNQESSTTYEFKKGRPKGAKDKKKRRRKSQFRKNAEAFAATVLITGGAGLATAYGQDQDFRKKVNRRVKYEYKIGRRQVKRGLSNLVGTSSSLRGRVTQRRTRKNLEKMFKNSL